MKNTKKKIGNSFVNTKTNNSFSVPKTTKNPLLTAFVNKENKTVTENNAPTYKSTLNSVLDFFAMGGALRSRSSDEIVKLFIKAFSEDQLLALKALYNVRNCRGGAGERNTFRVIYRWLGDNYPEIVVKNFGNTALFGRYDDFLSLIGTKVEKSMFDYIKFQLDTDVSNYENNQPISLLAKWLPSNNTSSKVTRELAFKFTKAFGWTPKQYRKTLAELRGYSNIVEVKMSANNWSDIKFETVPSKASMNYKGAFSKHDAVRYGEYISAVKRGEKKINAAALFPYEIIAKVRASYGKVDETLDVLWNSLPNYLEDNTRNILAVCDVSGSMQGTPMDMSISLGIYTAERNKGPFGNCFITYSEQPTFQQLTGSNIREKFACLTKTVAYNTNLQAVFDLILNTALENKVEQKDLPEQILLITDVEFDHPQNHGGNWRGEGGSKTNLDVIREKFSAAGYEMPTLVFWNVRSAQNNVPAKATDKNVLLVSGASPTVFKTLLSGKQYTPVDQMLETLNASQYDSVIV